jgi:hypothetical protein
MEGGRCIQGKHGKHTSRGLDETLQRMETDHSCLMLFSVAFNPFPFPCGKMRWVRPKMAHPITKSDKHILKDTIPYGHTTNEFRCKVHRC